MMLLEAFVFFGIIVISVCTLLWVILEYKNNFRRRK